MGEVIRVDFTKKLPSPCLKCPLRELDADPTLTPISTSRHLIRRLCGYALENRKLAADSRSLADMDPIKRRTWAILESLPTEIMYDENIVSRIDRCANSNCSDDGVA